MVPQREEKCFFERRLRLRFMQCSALLLEKSLHRTHLCLLSISVNDTSDLHQFENIQCSRLHKCEKLSSGCGCLSPLQTSQTFLTSLKWVELTLLCFALVYLSGHIAALESVRLFSFLVFEPHLLKMWLLTVESRKKRLFLTIWVSEVFNRTADITDI